MPAGPGPIGFIAFAGVKFAGYTFAAMALNRVYKSSSNVIKVGLTRTGIGLVAGAVVGAIWFGLSMALVNRWPDWLASVAFFGLLIPIRLCEWAILIHLFFDKGLVERGRAFDCAAVGSFWSFALDAIGIGAAFVVPGGFWIC